MHLRFCLIILILGIDLLLPFFTYGEDRIWLNDATIDGKPVKFIFDSGAGNFALTSNLASRLELKLDSHEEGYNFTAPYTFEWGGNPIRTEFAVLNISRTDFDGLVGWTPFSSSVMQIDANALKIIPILKLPEDVAHWTQFKLMTNFGTLDLEVPHSDGTKGIISIDTGADFGLALSTNLWLQWKKTHPRIPSTIKTYQTMEGFVVKEESWADQICIGSLILTNVPIMEEHIPLAALWGKEYDGTLGLAAISRIDIIVDGIHSVAYLKARTTPSRLYIYNRLGADFVPASGGANNFVATVAVGSPAYQAGIRNGDVLLQVDKVHVTDWPGDWESRFKLPAGTKLTLELERNGTNYETEATLREILQPDK